MATATVTNIPDEILEQYGTQIDFSLLSTFFSQRSLAPTISTQRSKRSPQISTHHLPTQRILSTHTAPLWEKKQTFRERMNDPSNTTHGPYSMDEFLAILKTW